MISSPELATRWCCHLPYRYQHANFFQFK